MVERRRSEMYGWVVAGVFWLLIFSYGLNWFAVAPLLKDLESMYGIGGAESHLLLSIIGLFVVFFAWPAGRIVDKKGPRYSVLIGALLMVIGFAGRIWLNDSYPKILLATSIAGFGLAWILVALAPQMIQWFKEKASLAIGVVSSGLFIGFGTASLLSPYIKNIYGLNAVYTSFAVLSLIALLLYLIFGKDREKAEKESVGIIEGFRGVFSSKNAILYSLIGFFIVGSTLSASALLPKIAINSGMSEVQGGNIISAMLFGSALGAFAFPYVANKYGVKRSSLLIAILGVILWLVFRVNPPFAIYLLISFLFGVCLQATWPVALHCQETEKGVNEKNVGIAASLYISVSNVGGAILPVAIGKVADQSLNNAFILLLAYLVIFTILWGIVKRK
ncbi:MAG: MFS transporter [Thermoplasmata archaeon]|nr:MAG: MFS transporter [Thermoplasmata archaeon]